MARIKRLSEEVSDKIAAGEVVERPVSVVKELVENSIDASASRIAIQIGNGGKSVIRVDDDGEGIPSGQLPLAVENFTTNKINSVEDIYGVSTMGFRGEALASIKAVSRLKIISRAEGEETGREMQWAGGEILGDKPSVRGKGTEVLVEDLFYNLPARRKFLSSDRAEKRRINAYVKKVSLIFPGISFSLDDKKEELLNYPASKLEDRVGKVLGVEIFSQMKHIRVDRGSYGVSGYISMPGLTRGNRSQQFIFVNRRLIKDKLINHAVGQAYQSLIPGNRFPILVLFIELPPEEVDINVHPAKLRIRFSDERRVHRLVSSSLRDELGGRGMDFHQKVKSVYSRIFPDGEISREGNNREEITRLSQGDLDYGRGVDSAPGEEGKGTQQEAPASLFGEKHESNIDIADNLYWQLHNSYIMIQIRGGMVIVDQHAAHERILFDRAKENLKGKKAVVQSLLFPATLELSPDGYERFEDMSDVLQSLGFEIEPFGMHSIIVRAIPAGVKNWNEGTLVEEIMSEAGTGRSKLEDFLKTYACRSAVKAGTRLSIQEMENLADSLFATEYPFTCPHGRPTMLRVELSELERRFQRTVRSDK